MNSCQSLLELLNDEYMLKIIHATGNGPSSISEMSREYDIPITACYRRVEFLRGLDIIFESGNRTSVKGRRIKLYRSDVEKIELRFEKGQMMLEMSTHDGIRSAKKRDVLMDLEFDMDPVSEKKVSSVSENFVCRN